MNPLEKEWAREQAERDKEAAEMAAALALGKSNDADAAPSSPEPQYTNMHRLVPRVTIAQNFLDLQFDLVSS